MKLLEAIFVSVTILILILLQLGVLPPLFGYYPSFNALLCVSLALCFRGYYRQSLWFSFISGVFLDLFLFSPFGLSGALLILFSWIARNSLRLLGRSWSVLAILCFLISLTWRVIFGFPSFSRLFLVGALEDVFLVFLMVLFFVPLWEKLFGKTALQLNLGI